MTAFSAVLIEGGRVETDFSDDELVREVISLPAVTRDRDRHHLAITQCVDCGRLFVAAKYQTSGQWESVWPLSKRSVPEDVPPAVAEAFEDAGLCLAAGALGGCLMMCRTAMERLWREQGVGRLKDLKDAGKISEMVYGQADEVRLWANVATHEDYSPDAITFELCQELVGYVGSLLDAVYLQPAKLAQLQLARKQASAKNNDHQQASQE